MDKRFLYLRQALLMFVFSLLAFSCSDEMHMLFPEGPQGPAGLSAYEVWVKAVNDGEVDWPKDRTDINNFFLFLKGKDGKDGINGVDGLDGKSAYEIWKEQVAQGIEDPHNPGNEWPKDHDSLQDFWYYLSGADGQDGSTPKIGDNGNWWINGEDTGIPARGKDGQDGQNGHDGKDGKDAVAPTVEIGSNGNWWINGEDTGVPARGKDGQDGQDGADGLATTVTIGDNGNWYVDGKDTGVPATGPKGADGNDGKDGLTWVILDNGNWGYYDIVNNKYVDSGRPATGPKGDPGKDGSNGTQFVIGENGNWWMYNYETGKFEDTGKPSRGEKGEQGEKGDDGNAGGSGSSGNDGKDGKDGLSAYDLWVKEVTSANGLADPHDPSKLWPKDKTSMSDFWEYLRGVDGKDGAPGKDGIDATGVIQPRPTEGFYSVIADYSNSSHREYVRWGDGAVSYTVYDDKGQTVGEGIKVSGMPKINADMEYTTDQYGRFIVPKEDLPENANNSIDIYGKPKVTLADGTEAKVAQATYVPCRMQVKVEMVKNELGNGKGVGNIATTDIWFRLFRKTDAVSDWEGVPSWIGETNGRCLVSRYDSNLNKLTKEYMQDNGNAKAYDLNDRPYDHNNILGESVGMWIARKVKSTKHYDFTKEGRFVTNKWCVDQWYGKTKDNGKDEEYFIGFKIVKRPDGNGKQYGGICYGLEPECETYVQEVPMLPMPYFEDIKASYNIDNTNIHVFAKFCEECLDNCDKVYLQSYKKEPERINQKFYAMVPEVNSSPKTVKGIRLYAKYTSATSDTEVKSHLSYSVDDLTGSTLDVENIKPGSVVGVCCDGDFARTYYQFPVGEISAQGVGDQAVFTFDTSKYPAIQQNPNISRKNND